MSNIIIFFLYFYLLLTSVIGFGFCFYRICFQKNQELDEQKIIYIGFYGLFFLTLISLLTSIILPHNLLHNILIHSFGFSFFFLFKYPNKKKYFKKIFLISLFLISAILISKTHDDFSYYHLPFTKYLTEHKVIFGMANLGHGYKWVSSLFFLNSTFYLPFIEYYSFHFTSVFILIFFNYFLLYEIKSKYNDQFLKYLFLLALAFFNLSFNRIAEYGTDKGGQLLIVVLVFKVFQLIFSKKKETYVTEIFLLIPLFAFCLIMKMYFLPYILIGFVLIILSDDIVKIFKNIIFSKYFIILIFSISLFLTHHFISTGCIVSPISFTCFGDNLNWADGKAHYTRMHNAMELWAKSGMDPNYKVSNPAEYLKNFNWVPRWFENYFIGKVTDQLLIYITIVLFVLFLFKKLKLENNTPNINKKFLLFYLTIIVIFYIWLTKHPQLRYGGYAICFLVLSIPLTLIFQKFEDKNFFKKKFNYFVLMIMLIFNFKNISRINNEFKREDNYKFNNFPFFAIPDKEYIHEKTESGLVVYKTNGHCWNVPSPCAQSQKKLSLKTLKKNGYYFFYK